MKRGDRFSLGVLACVCGCALVFSGFSLPLQSNGLPVAFESLSGPDSYEPHHGVVRRGTRMDSMRLIAPASIRTALSGWTGPILIEFFATPVFNVGDGMQLDILSSGAGAEELLFSRYFDAGRKSGDREWVHIEIPATIRQTREWLVLRLSGGPQGDLDADWLAIASMHLSRRAP